MDQYLVEYKLVGGIKVSRILEGESKESVLDEAKMPLEHTFEDENSVLQNFSNEDVVLISVSKVSKKLAYTSVGGTR